MKHTGPGLIDKSLNAHPPRLLLYNFDVDGSNLKAEHERALFSSVIPTLRAGGSVSIVGLASRSGSMGHNQRLSLHRANNVLRVLRQNVSSKFNLRLFYGTHGAGGRVYGLRDGARDYMRYQVLGSYRGEAPEDPVFRSVLVFVWARSVPLRPNVPGDVLLSEMPKMTSGLEEAEEWGEILEMGEKGLDGVHYAGEAALLGLDFAGVTEVAGVAVEFLAAANVCLEGVALILSLPATWLSSFALAKRTGKIYGFANAMESMAVAVAQDRPIPHPAPSAADFQNAAKLLTVDEKLGWEGRKEGYELAYSHVTKLEKSPKEITLTLGGRPRKAKLTGRRLLLLLSRACPEGIARKLVEQFEER